MYVVSIFILQLTVFCSRPPLLMTARAFQSILTKTSLL